LQKLNPKVGVSLQNSKAHYIILANNWTNFDHQLAGKKSKKISKN